MIDGQIEFFSLLIDQYRLKSIDEINIKIKLDNENDNYEPTRIFLLVRIIFDIYL